MIFFLSQRDAVEMAALTLIQGQFPQIQKEELSGTREEEAGSEECENLQVGTPSH